MKETAKRRIKVPRGTLSRALYTPPKLPKKPPVDEFAKTYGRTITGSYIVPRFWITPFWGNWMKINKSKKVWWIIDNDEANLAAGTSKTGYQKKEAKSIAEELRDEFGAWSTVPF